ncbi:hypothetical protein CJ227_02495 [Micrococcus luteus]|uniref:hypothetical protein n=1 Tax=Micrococcus TaxID=1269 RepID=UPI000C9C54E8|nr:MULTISPECIES: hypothetical protein [Micrococcus]PMC39891.1 hypothetical protein CJ227_02495 [Micrococcus luteus]
MKSLARSIASFGAAAAVALTGLVAAPAAQAATTCTGTVTERTISGDLTVPSGATCTLVDSTVIGDFLWVEPNATLITEDSTTGAYTHLDRGATLRATGGSFGDVIADRQKLIRMHGTTVTSMYAAEGGTVTTTRMKVREDATFYKMGGTVSHSWGRIAGAVTQADSTRNRIMVRSSHVGSDINVYNSGHVLIGRNIVGGSIWADANRGTMYIEGNTIDSYLSCFNNQYQPTGGNNTAWEKWGQCAGL